MTIDQIIIKNLFDSTLNGINYSFLNVIPTAIKAFIAVLSTSLIVFAFVVVLCLSIAFVYFSIRDLFKNNQNKTILCIMKDEFQFVYDKLKNPVADGFWIRVDKRTLPLMFVLLFLILGWQITLPLLAISIVSNDKIGKLINFKLNLWLFAFLMIIFYVNLILSP